MARQKSVNMMWVSVELLSKMCNPLVNPPWDKLMEPITYQEIAEASESTTEPKQAYDSFFGESRQMHINRIAWFAIHGWHDAPIEINMNDVSWVVWDGNHRLAAAIYRGDEMIWADVEGPKDRIALLYQDSGLT